MTSSELFPELGAESRKTTGKLRQGCDPLVLMAPAGTVDLAQRFFDMIEPAQLLPHAERLRTMARVARGVAARLAQQADRKRLEGYAENLERQASDILSSANRRAGCGPSH